jgi:glycosyltransferase involved in cell wall biosynthesis
MSIKLTIITINYNDKIGLQKTIKSVVNQTWKDFEFVVIDGGSTDGSKELIELYKNYIDYSISEPDSGIYNAMNKGIKVAKGEFLLFLNSGDSLQNNSVLEKVHTELNNNFSIFYGKLIISTNNIDSVACCPPYELKFSYFLDYSLPHQATFINRNLFIKYFYYNESLKIMADWEFIIFVICKMNEPYKYLDILISNYDDGGISSSVNSTKLLLNEKEIVLKNHFPTLYSDSKSLKMMNSKRFKQIENLKKNKFKWNFLKLIINLLTIFEKKQTSEFTKYYKKI